MPEPTTPISPETRKQMESICRRASAARRDDSSRVADELYGHLEDKLLAYLRGDERLTEADAMILVREHFGKPETLRTMLEGAHAEPAAENLIPWPRRMLAISLALAAISFCEFIIRSLVFDIPMIVALNRDGFVSATRAWGGAPITSGVLAVLVAVALLFVVLRWQRREDLETTGWMTRWNTGRIVACILALLAVRDVTICLVNQWYYSFPPSAVHGEEPPFRLVMAFLWIGMVAAHAQCLIWVLWIARRRPWWMGIVAAAGWFAFAIAGKVIYTLTAMSVSDNGFFLSRFSMLRGPYHGMVAVNVLSLFLVLRFAAWVSRQLAHRGVRPLFSR